MQDETVRELVPEDLTSESLLQARIPHLAGGPKTAEAKAEYLGYRATGFAIRQACHLTGVTHSTLGRWRASDPEFRKIESERLPELQQELGGDLVRLDFLRNMRLAIRGDFKVLLRGALHMESLTDREFAYLRTIRRHYTPADLATMTKALEPEGAGEVDFAELVLRITQTRAEVHIKKEPTNEGSQDGPDQNKDIIEGVATPT